MKAENNGAKYQVLITSTTRKKGDGSFVEEVGWSDLVSDGKPRVLTSTAEAFRLEVTLGGGLPFVMPDLSTLPGLVGPVLDVLTFYADQFLAIHRGAALQGPGDRVFVEMDLVPSWADGQRVLLGEDHIHIEISLIRVDRSAGLAMLLVRHVPPADPKIRLPADWMRTPVAGTPNNWVQVRKTATGYAASIGRETFDVQLVVSLANGAIVSADMENPVTAITRECRDAALTDCGEATTTPTLRRIQMELVP
jgi:hypothetical protein